MSASRPLPERQVPGADCWKGAVAFAYDVRLSAALPTGSDGAVQTGSVDYVAPELRDPNALPKAQSDVATYLGILDAALAGQTFLLDDYTLADTHLQGFVGWIASMGIDLSQYVNVDVWAKRCSQRPALAALEED
jgi:glutathione S-transferase